MISDLTRRIVRRTAGHSGGGITRLMSPGDLGEHVKPFVFLDHFEFTARGMGALPMHPHSGIATHTTLIQGSLDYADSTGKSGRLTPGSIEWMHAGGGVWHTGAPIEGETVRGFQLWVALPAAIENTPPASHYIEPSRISGDERVRLLLGTYGELRTVIPYEQPVTYLHVRLRDGEAWSYQPAPGHDVAWLAVDQGAVRVGDVTVQRQMAVFEEGNAPIDVVAQGETGFVIGSAAKHPHALVTGRYSVHTSRAALELGEAGIRRVAADLDMKRSA